MFEMITALISIVILFIGLSLCFAISDKYRSERNIFRDKWINAVDRYKDHLIDENRELKYEIDDLKNDIAELKKTKDNEENNHDDV